MRKTSEKLIVLDLEATCWDGTVPAGEQSEIIEIGICELDTKKLSITQSHSFLIKPTRSTVSAFCTKLTSITAEMLNEQGITFTEAIQQILDLYKPQRITWASWGDYDRNMLKQSCTLENTIYPFGKTHLNIKSAAALLLGERERGMLQLLEQLQIPHEGTHHRGLDDALNIAKIWAVLCSRMRANM
ncbi:MAG: DNA polymerase III [Cytophagales bacterium]|nr:MAG: DNA polymerase III [Cytophagales bacterium]TAF59340.1 MAG: DNA polymerase III [Cytophagales bacterium]